MRYDVEQINALDVVEVARKLGLEVKKRGSTLVCCCPWHNDTKPSMQLWTKRQMMHCYACDETHNNIGAVMKTLGKDFKAACEWFADNFPNECIAIENLGNICQSPTHKNVEQIQQRGLTPLMKKVWNRNGGEKGTFPKNGNSLKRLEALVRKGATPCPSLLSGEEKTFRFSIDFLRARMTLANSFCRCMVEVFGTERTVEVMRQYWLGSLEAHGRYADVLFPNINVRGEVTGIKVQAYDCDTRSNGFFHRLPYVCYWLKASSWYEATSSSEVISKSASISESLPPGFLSPAKRGNRRESMEGASLFGEHLLSRHPDRVVVLVESPKNACVGAAAYPQYVWLATGNKGMLKRSVLEVLQGRMVVVFPDEDAYDEWAEKLEGMKDIACFTVQRAPKMNEKSDIADFIIGAPLNPPEGDFL